MKWAFLIFGILFFIGVVSAAVYPAPFVEESLAGGNNLEIEEQEILSDKLERDEITKEDFEEWYEEKKEKEIKNQIEFKNNLKFKQINLLDQENNSFEFEAYGGEKIRFNFEGKFYTLEFSTKEGHNFRESKFSAVVISKCYKVKYLNMKKDVCWDIEEEFPFFNLTLIDFQLKNLSLGDYVEIGKFRFEIKPFFLCGDLWINGTCYGEGDSFELEGKNYSVVDGSLVKVDGDSLENNVVNKLTGNAVGIFESSFENETNKKISLNEEKSFFDKLFKRLVFWN